MYKEKLIYNILSCAYSCTDFTISSKYRQMYSYITKQPLHEDYVITAFLDP
jgi:hypothetical protein